MTEQNNEVAPPTYSPEVEEDELTKNHIYVEISIQKLQHRSDVNECWYKPIIVKKILKVVPNDDCINGYPAEISCVERYTYIVDLEPRVEQINRQRLYYLLKNEQVCVIKLKDFNLLKGLFVADCEPFVLGDKEDNIHTDGFNCYEDILFIYSMEVTKIKI